MAKQFLAGQLWNARLRTSTNMHTNLDNEITGVYHKEDAVLSVLSWLMIAALPLGVLIVIAEATGATDLIISYVATLW